MTPKCDYPDRQALVEGVDFMLVGAELGEDLERALHAALAGGAVFHESSDPLAVFRQALADSIYSIESHPHGKLIQRFLLEGPYERAGDIPKELVDQRLSDSESASVIKFIYSHMVNCFKGAIAELLGTQSCLRLLKDLQSRGELPAAARLYIGNAVMIHRKSGRGA